jgi:hypothetical protein
MKKFATALPVSVIMIIAILGITNPVNKQNPMFDYEEGKLTRNYFIFSIYQQPYRYTVIEKGKYRLYKRYIGIAMHFYEISPLKVKQE